MYIPARIYFFGQATTAPHPTLKACLSVPRGAVHRVEKSEAAGLSELVPANLTFPLSPTRPGWIWGVSRSGPLPRTPLLPQFYPRPFWVSGFSILGRAARLWESQPSVPWAQPWHAIALASSLRQAWAGDRRRRRRRRAVADQTRDKSQLKSKQPGSGVGAPAGGASPGWPALGGVRLAPAFSECCSWLATCWSCVCDHELRVLTY